MADPIKSPRNFFWELIVAINVDDLDASDRVVAERLIAERDAAVAAAARLTLENELVRTKGILAELHGYVAQMCEHFGDKREEVLRDARRLRDHVARAVAAHDRLQTVVDERIGIEPVLTADELITIVERTLGEWHRRNVEQSERIASLEAKVRTAREEALMQVFRIITKNWDPQSSMAHRVYQATADLILETRGQPPSLPAEPAQEEP